MNKKYTIELTEDEMIRYYANKIVEDSLDNCSEFHYDMDVNQYEDNGFVEQHKEQIIDRINKDEKVLEVYFDEEYSTINMCFGIDWCPYYYDEYDLEPETEITYLKAFIIKEIHDLEDLIDIRTTRDLVRQFMDSYIENSTRLDDDTKDAIYNSIKEHICNTGFVDKYIDKYEVYVDKNNIKELKEGLELEIDKLRLKQYYGIQYISMDKFREMINKHNKDLRFDASELGKFITKENGIYLGINNCEGEMRFIDFDNLDKCLDYLGIEEKINEEEQEEM